MESEHEHDRRHNCSGLRRHSNLLLGKPNIGFLRKVTGNNMEVVIGLLCVLFLMCVAAICGLVFCDDDYDE